MIKVFHYDRSTACQRVRLLLEEKKLEWESTIVDTARGDIDDLPENYYTLNPKGLTPVIIHEGKAIPESLIILEYLEDKFPTPCFRPDSAEDKANMRLWMRKIDDGIHVASRTIGVCLVNRHIYEEKDPDLIKKYYDKMKDEVRKNNDQVNIEYGLESPLLPNAIAQFKKLFTEMDNHLKTHKWLVNDNYSLADIALVVYLQRLESFMMAPLWSDLRYLDNWYERISNRKAYKVAVLDWGDITASKRKENGLKAFKKINQYWLDN
jgi:glutathione S-transferase